MSIRLLVAKGSGPTGRTLAKLLEARGVQLVEMNATHVVSYGVPYVGVTPSLNKHAGNLDKYEQGQALARAGVSVVPHMTPAQAANYNAGPMLARRRNHVGGKDIMVCLEPADVRLRTQAGAQFFTPYIPSTGEFRVWVFRKAHLGTYQKVLTYPEKYKKIGRNYDNGFTFELVKEAAISRDAVDLAQRAIAALGLDFGAVDILAGRDGRFYVLEVNTAPGVEGEGRQVIQALADRIVRWATGEKQANPKPVVKRKAKPLWRGW